MPRYCMSERGVATIRVTAMVSRLMQSWTIGLISFFQKSVS